MPGSTKSSAPGVPPGGLYNERLDERVSKWRSLAGLYKERPPGAAEPSPVGHYPERLGDQDM